MAPLPRRNSILRSWERVARSLTEIHRLAKTFEGTAGEGKVWNAEHAMLNLLVDSQTAEELELRDDPPPIGEPSGGDRLSKAVAET